MPTLAALEELRGSIDSAAAVITSLSSNKHFDIPQPVSSIFTGRGAMLKDLKKILITPPGVRDSQQRRFVICGIAGSGKTQFCSKFAEDNRDRFVNLNLTKIIAKDYSNVWNSFWGVFWIDASTPERIKQTFSQIAKVASVDPNENAALHWLSNTEERWLLIIDNADNQKISLERYFPKGNRGHILVTTRNPALRIHGNIGTGFFDFQSLDNEDAKYLLLKAARQPEPWDSTCSAFASAIAKALGFLALAIVQAGAVIRDGLCSLKNYLNFYERSWQRLRQAKTANGHAIDDTKDHHMHIYTTWEMCYRRIESKGTQAAEDAIQLLKTFSFLHWENIQHDLLRRAVANAVLEAEHEENRNQREIEAPINDRQTWTQRFRGLSITFLLFILKNRSPPVLPNVVRDARRSGSIEDYDDRLRFALRELIQMSLITYNDANNSYSMHPAVHKWARERPEMRVSEQGLWCEAAAMILSASILLPPLGSSKDEDFNRALLPHLDHITSCHQSINDRLTKRSQSQWTTWIVPKWTMNPERALMYAKFSLVYAQCGRWDSAEALQIKVKDFIYKTLGPAHEKSRRITLFLAETYWHLGRGDKAAGLQREVLDLCNTFLEPDHPDTLKVKDRLGETLWQQGRYSEALALHTEAVDGLTRRLSRNHEDTLNAIDNLGRTIARFWEREHFEQAYTLHQEAVAGMERAHGPDHPRTLTAKENLAKVGMHLGGDFLEPSSKLIHEVLQKRKEKLGKEHPYTLLAMVNTAIIKCALGKFKEAEELVLYGIPIAERNLGKDHIGTLFGQQNLASIFIQQRRYAEAEAILTDVTERQKRIYSRRGDYHPDRLGALIELAKCHRLQDNIEASIRVCDEALEGFGEISISEHPLARDLKRARDRMAESRKGNVCYAESATASADLATATPGPYSVF